MKEQELIILNNKLRDKREFKHHILCESLSHSKFKYTCQKCKKEFTRGKLKSEWVSGVPGHKKFHSNDPCPVPDQLFRKDGTVASEADIAEEIRLWAETNDAESYWSVLRDMYREAMSYGDGFDAWLTYHCTPADKITAFCSIFNKKVLDNDSK